MDEEIKQVEPDMDRTTVLVVFGRTGAGKSSLGNKLLQLTAGEEFRESASIISETQCAASKTKPWMLDPTLYVKLVDTPGFGDNSGKNSRQELLTNTFKFLKELRAGFNIGILCVNATQPRIDGYELDDFVALGRLLGNELFNHSIIALTQTNKLSEDEREAKIQELKTQLPRLLNDRNVSTDRITIFEAGWDRFDQFTEELGDKMATAPRWQSEVLERVDLDDPNAVENWLQDPKVTDYIEAKLSTEREKLEADYNNLKNAGYASKEDLQAILNKIADFQQPAPIIIKQDSPPPICRIF